VRILDLMSKSSRISLRCLIGVVASIGGPVAAAVFVIGCNEGDKGPNYQIPDPPVIVWDSTFVDGDVTLGEPFQDINGNGIWDGPGVIPNFPLGEPYDDLTHDGEFQGPGDPWAPGIPWIDHPPHIGLYDRPDSIKQPDEPNYFFCVNEASCFPPRHDCVSMNEPVCIEVSAISEDSDLTEKVLPNGFLSFAHGRVCWIPEAMGMQEVTIIVNDSFGQADTLVLSVYLLGCGNSR